MSHFNVTHTTSHPTAASKVFVPHNNTLNLLDFLSKTFSHIPRTTWQQRLTNHLVHDMQGNPLHANSQCAQQHIQYYRHVANEETIPVTHRILAETAHILVVDKPHYLPTTPTGHYVQNALVNRLKAETGYSDLTPLHRLDRETAGVILFCKTPTMRGAYQQLFAKRSVNKTYHALACLSQPLPPHWALDYQSYMQRGDPFYIMTSNTQQPPNSHTHIQLLSQHWHNQQWLAKFALQPSSGKMHQLRVHLHSLGMPILHDTLYPTVLDNRPEYSDTPLQLLAHAISWLDPINQQLYSFKSQFSLIY